MGVVKNVIMNKPQTDADANAPVAHIFLNDALPAGDGL